MEYRKLGRTGLKVSPLCLGTMNFGWHTPEQDSFALMDKALEMGTICISPRTISARLVRGACAGSRPM
jgi:aryl-alcohol dehydrogenase-like predicted oxidoreductase